MTEIKKDFPILSNEIVYLDNAASTQKPLLVINAVHTFYQKQYANIHRGLYKLSAASTDMYEDSKKMVAGFINADPYEIVYTKNATEGINIIARAIEPLIKGKYIVLSEIEHHANLIPWQKLAKRKGLTLKFIPLKKDFTLDYEAAQQLIDKDTAVVAITQVSNVLGTIVDVKKIINLANKNNAITLVDGAQSVPHTKVDVKDIGCDFMAFSSHKMLGPSGVGILYGKKKMFEQLEPVFFGGGIVSSVSKDNAEWLPAPERFEAGTPNLEGAIGLANAITYIKSVGIEKVEQIETELLSYALEQLKKVKGIKIYNAGPKKSAGIISFTIDGIHPHDIASLLDDDNICIRAGHHCAMPLMKVLGVTATARASFYLYNTKKDVDKLTASLIKITQVFKK